MSRSMDGSGDEVFLSNPSWSYAMIHSVFMSVRIRLSRNKTHGISSARSQRRLQARTASHRLALDANVLWVLDSVVCIRIDLCCITAWPQEIKRQIELSCIPVVETSQEPFIPMAARDCDVDARPAIQHTRFVPRSRRVFDELKSRLLVVRVWHV